MIGRRLAAAFCFIWICAFVLGCGDSAATGDVRDTVPGEVSGDVTGDDAGGDTRDDAGVETGDDAAGDAAPTDIEAVEDGSNVADVAGDGDVATDTDALADTSEDGAGDVVPGDIDVDGDVGVDDGDGTAPDGTTNDTGGGDGDSDVGNDTADDTSIGNDVGDTSVGNDVGDTSVGNDTTTDTSVGNDTAADTSVGNDTAADTSVGNDTTEDTSGSDAVEDTSVGDTTNDVDAGAPACPAACFDNTPCTIDGCAADGSCLDEAAAIGTPCLRGVCDGYGSCVLCLDDHEEGMDTGCPVGRPMCSGDNRCGACLEDTDCPSGLVCDPDALVCTNCERDEECDDGLECTIDVCEGRLCDHVADDGACDDGLFCNGDETCDPLSLDADADGCASGDEPDMDDDVACTVDFCNESDDAIGHPPEDTRCPDLSPCASSTCSADAGCVVTPAPGGTLCAKDAGVRALGACLDCTDSGNGVDQGCGGAKRFCVAGACAACTVDDDCPSALTCEGGACVGCSVDAECDDGVACTNDACDPETSACVNLVDDALCDDGLYCDGLERCLPESASADARGCIDDAVPEVDDGIVCTIDACDEAANRVVHTPDRDLCDDGNDCTNESCSLSLGCLHEVLVGQGPCDGDEGFCDAEGVCAACVDDSVGDIDLGCDASAPACVDGGCVVCTAPGDGCPIDCAGVAGGASVRDLCGTCDDDPGNDCLGLCDGVPCGASCDGSVAGECDDGKPCTLDQCVAGRCKNDAAAMDGSVCDDQAPCTSSSTCAAGVCVGSAQVVCGGTCQTGACDAETGCIEAPPGTECNDGSPGVASPADAASRCATTATPARSTTG